MPGDGSHTSSVFDEVRSLAIPGADFDSIEDIAARLKAADFSTARSLKPLHVKLLANFTSDYLTDHLRLMLVRSGFAPDIEPGQYGGLVRGLLEGVGSEAAGALVIVLTHRDVQFPPPLGIDVQGAKDLAAKEVDFWVSLLAKSKVPTVVVSFDQPSNRVLAEQDAMVPGGLGWHVKMTNLGIAERLPTTHMLIDAEALQYRVGAALWNDDRLYQLCKQPFAMEALPEIAHTIAAAMVGLFGGGRKVLILDLDNTLWGGVVGDDGLQGIEIGRETAEGEAFASFQEYALNLSKRGIVLAVCSKNRDEVARSPFREHSGMVLKEDHISCFIANFDDKAKNIRLIAKTLNLGLDSFVFVDDNPVERALIKAELPEVLTVDLPEDPAYYARAVEACKAFPLRALTREDLSRVESYKAMAVVQEAAASGTDMEQFLIGLTPTAVVENVNESTVDRIAQLIRKTNQFKLNLSQFQESDILEARRDVFALRLSDRLQDYGIVAIVVTKPENGALNILNWVMSCRVFSRRLENATLELLSAHAKARGCKTIQAAYTPTEKNVILPPILKRLGFAAADGSHLYAVPADQPATEPHYMTINDKRASP